MENNSNSKFSITSEMSKTPSVVSGYLRETIQKVPWANIHCFCASICLLITVNGTMTGGYISGVLSTIEKRFEITSRISGLILSSYEIGSLLSVLFVSYFGSHGHTPKWIGSGALLLALGATLLCVPHFLAGAPEFDPTKNHVSNLHCHVGKPGTEHGSENATKCDASSWGFVGIFMFAQIIIGMGGSPLFTLGTTYIDNNVPKDSSSLYLAFMYVCSAFGPVLGFLLVPGMLASYSNPFSAPPNLNHTDPQWIGMWWGGFIICGGFYFISALPFFGFPRKLTSKEPSSNEEIDEKSLQKIPCALWKLMKNSIYMLASLLACTDLAIVQGFLIFLPKYLETQFGLSKSTASVATGSVAVPGACIGIALGGWILKRWKLHMNDMSKIVVLINFFCLAVLTLFFVFGCPNLKMAGVFSNYQSSRNGDEFLSPLKKSVVDLTDPCNEKCSCSMDYYSPVCGVSDETTYFSPCFAGCYTPIYSNSVLKGYANCACVSKNATLAKSKQVIVSPGTCENGCSMLAPFLLLLFVLSFVASICQTPIIMIILRAVPEKDKAFSLGFQVVMLRVLSYIPAPIIFGTLIDTACLVFKKSCGADKNCLVYDIETFRFRYGSLVLGLKVLAACFSLGLLFSVKKRGPKMEGMSPPISVTELAHRFGDAKNLHIRPHMDDGIRSWMSDDMLYTRPKSPKKHQKTFSSYY